MRRSVDPARSRNRLVFLNRFFYPAHSATSQTLTELAFHLAGSGADVHVITSQQGYDSPRASLPNSETVDDIDRHGFYYVGLGRQIERKTLESCAPAPKYFAARLSVRNVVTRKLHMTDGLLKK